MNWGTTPVSWVVWWMLVGKLEFEAYLDMAQELSAWLKRVCAKTENQFSQLIQIARILKLECCLQNSMVSIGFLSLFMFCTKPFVRLKAARTSPLSETRARSSLSNENSPETNERCRRFQKNEILIHISCTTSADFYYFLTVFHRYNYTYLELTFINKT